MTVGLGRRAGPKKAAGSPKGRSPGRTRSFACPDELWAEVQAFTDQRGLGSTSDGLRSLIRDGLRLSQRFRELEEARDWQIEQAWAEAQAIANGDRSVGRWEDIERAFDRARAEVQKQPARWPASQGELILSWPDGARVRVGDPDAEQVRDKRAGRGHRVRSGK